MKKIVLYTLCFFFVVGCATYPKIQKLNSLSPGISKAELASYFDGHPPISTDLIEGHYLLKYKMTDGHDIRGMRPYYFIFDQHDHLIGWEEIKGKKKIFAGGVSILIPLPSR